MTREEQQKIKGLAIVPVPDFVKDKFGEDGYDKWIKAISQEAAIVYAQKIPSKNWYDLKNIFCEPCRIMSELFYEGDGVKCARELGSYCADRSFEGVCGIFKHIGNENTTVRLGTVILGVYYEPGKAEIAVNEKEHAIVVLRDFLYLDDIVANRIAGWLQRGLEICGFNGPQAAVKKHFSAQEPVVEIEMTWEERGE